MGFLNQIDLGTVLIQFAVLLFSLSAHEASHAWTADYFGDYTARYLGRVTLNPIPHMDPIGTLLFPLISLITHFPLIGWAKPVPVNSVHLRNPRRDQILISLAGPGANLALAAFSLVTMVILKLVSSDAAKMIDRMIVTQNIPHEKSIVAPVIGLLFFALVVNLALALFNCIPVPPLDGHWVLYELLPFKAAQVFRQMSAYGFLVLYAMMYFNLFSFVFIPIKHVLLFLYKL